MVGSDEQKQRFRILKLDRTVASIAVGGASATGGPAAATTAAAAGMSGGFVVEDDVWYSREQIQQLLVMIKEGNRGTFREVLQARGIVGTLVGMDDRLTFSRVYYYPRRIRALFGRLLHLSRDKV